MARCECGGELKLLGAAGSAGRLRYRCKKCKRRRWGTGNGLPDLEDEYDKSDRTIYAPDYWPTWRDKD